MLPIENYTDATDLLQVFDLFYYINGRFPFTTGLLPIPDRDFPAFVGDQKLSIKKLGKQFRDSLSHGIVVLPFICALNFFLSGDPEKSKNPLTELYYNVFLEILSDEYEQSSTYDAISELFAEVSTGLQEAIRSNKLKREEGKNKNEDIKK